MHPLLPLVPSLPVDIETVPNVYIELHQAESYAATGRITVPLKLRRVCTTKARNIHQGERANCVKIQFTTVGMGTQANDTRVRKGKHQAISVPLFRQNQRQSPRRNPIQPPARLPSPLTLRSVRSARQKYNQAH